jgi:hypothetical protein
MPSDETRRLLKNFGVAVTEYEDAIRNSSSEEKMRESEADARSSPGGVGPDRSSSRRFRPSAGLTLENRALPTNFRFSNRRTATGS